MGVTRFMLWYASVEMCCSKVLPPLLHCYVSIKWLLHSHLHPFLRVCRPPSWMLLMLLCRRQMAHGRGGEPLFVQDIPSYLQQRVENGGLPHHGQAVGVDRHRGKWYGDPSCVFEGAETCLFVLAEVAILYVHFAVPSKILVNFI